MATIEVVNQQRDTKTLRTVWNTSDGEAPVGTVELDADAPPISEAKLAQRQAKADRAARENVESYTLTLGSSDDDTDDVRKFNRDNPAEAITLPVQEVPAWALPLLRAIPLFKHWEDTNAVRVQRRVAA